MATTAKIQLSAGPAMSPHLVEHLPSMSNSKNTDPTLEIADTSVPLIDLEGLHGSRRSSIINQIAKACKDYGFFLVKNHGIPETILDDMHKVSKDFFHLPEAERLKFRSYDMNRGFSLTTGTHSSGNEAPMVPAWRDVLKIKCFPSPESLQYWPSNPPSFIKNTEEYSTRARKLMLELLEAISESLNLEKDYIDKAGRELWYGMAINNYPPCPQPELHLGSLNHTDPGVITLLQTDGSPGLEFSVNGKWLPVNPHPNTLLVTVGDALKMLSNGEYHSPCHRVKVRSEEGRMSVASFCLPSKNATVGPAEEMIDDDHPPLYPNVVFGEFLANGVSKGEGHCVP